MLVLPLILAGLLAPGAAIHLQGSKDDASRTFPKVGLSVPVHPPKFSYVTRFLEQYAACPAARRNMMVVVVFSNQRDFAIFQEGLQLFNKSIPADAYTALVSDVPDHWKYQTQSQNICAWKKFYGIAHMMDMARAPTYGVIADAELMLFDPHDCGAHSKWNALHDRIKSREKARKWPAVRVTHENKFAFNFMGGLMEGLTQWTNRNNKTCTLPACKHLQLYADRTTISWWTDLPWVNLKVAGKMFTDIGGREKNRTENWKTYARPIRFCRYDHMAYQHWTVLHENFTFENVTNITGPTFGMATYTESENRNGSRVADLYPLWVSDRLRLQTLAPTKDRLGEHYAKLKALSKAYPPLLLFHTDLSNRHIKEHKFVWEERYNLSHGLIE